MNITLNVEQIFELASFAGLSPKNPDECPVDGESEITVKKGILTDEDGNPS